MTKYDAFIELPACDTSYDITKMYDGEIFGDGWLSRHDTLPKAKRAVIKEIDDKIASLKEEKKRIRSIRKSGTLLQHLEGA